MRKLLVMVVLAVGVMVSTSFGQNAGVVWTEVKNSPLKEEMHSYIVWGKDRFVAAGWNRTIAYSLDGVTWTAVKDNPFESIASIYWYNGWFIACGVGKEDSTGSRKDISAYSSDGITWTSYESDFRFNNIAYGNNKFVAINNDCNVAYSTDGVTWSLASVDDWFSGFSCVGGEGGMSGRFNVVWGNGMFISLMPYLAHEDIGIRTRYSLDGINWTATEEHGQSFGYVVWGNDKFVASGRGIRYSSDGITWKEVKSNIFGVHNGKHTGRYTGTIAWGNNKFIVHVYYDECGEDYCATRGEKFAYSSDGITWALAKNYPFGKSATTKIVYGNGVFVAVSEDGKLAYSK